MPKRIFTILLSFVITASIFAQGGTLKGKITDAETGEPIPFASVSVMKDGTIITGGATDFDGYYTIKPIDAGKYDVKASYMGYQAQQLTGVRILTGKIVFQNFKLKASAQMLEEVEVRDYKVPLISKDKTESGGTVTSEDIAKMPGRNAASVATTVGGVYSEDGEIGSVRGARAEATVYYVDGVKVRGSSSVPKSAIEQVSVITGGVPARFGDATGGVISVTTKGPSRSFFGGAEVLTSHFLDPYDYNLAEITMSGPMLYRTMPNPADTTKTMKEPVAGFFLAANFTYQKDRYPSAIGIWEVDQDTLDYLIQNPLRPAESGFVNKLNAEYLQAKDAEGNDVFNKLDAQKNIKSYQMNLAGKLDYKPTRDINLTVGGTFDYRDQYLLTNNTAGLQLYNTRNFQVFNANNNGHQKYTNWRAYVRFTQKFSDNPDQEKKSLIRNAYYQIQFDYTQTNSITEDDSHGDNLFNYGYVGEFETYKIKSFELSDTVSGYPDGIIMHNGFADTLVTFEPSKINPVLSEYTDYYYSLFDQNSLYYRNYTFIENGGGLLNGMPAPNVYGIWAGPGTQYDSYTKSENTQFGVKVKGAADIKDHEISMGFEFEQRSDSYFGVAPVGLWELARGYMNFHILELDYGSPNYVPGPVYDTVYYDRLYNKEAQYQFDEEFRKRLGKEIDSKDWIDIDKYDPSYFSIDYFSADELLNNGSSLVTYYGFDHHGKKLSSKPSFEEFFTKTDDNGRYLRPIAPFEPNYSAAYIQDKFAFKDLIFNIGLRIDRYDANQQVLKDPYSVYETYKAGDVEGSLNSNGDHPSTIGNDYVVYVDDVNDPSKILGYRSGLTPATVKWYNSDGTQVDNPEKVEAATGITPYLVDPDGGVNANAFEDYEPQITWMPRISFSFPISDVALFFAHYDILSTRPTGNNRMNPLSYLFIENAGNRPINNPNLKPEKTIDYELGFQQKLTNTSSLKLSAFYREMKDMIQTQFIYGAYPNNYITYSNIDFGTVKGFTVTYDLRRTRNVSLRTSYTLQFANGTGSNAESGLSLIQTGQPNLRTTIPLDFDQRHSIVANLDYRFLSGRNYDGPKWFGKDILQNTGANFVVRFGTGSPYSKRELETDYLVGSLNGSRKPSRVTIDLRLDRTIEIEVGKEDENGKKKKTHLNVYFDISNLLNTKNVLNVYSKTGNADDDGYLVNPKNQNTINSYNDPAAFRNYYSMAINSPYNYSLPRRIRLEYNLVSN